MYINDSIEIVEAPISADDYLRLVEDVGWKRFVNPGPLSVPFGIQFAFVGVESENPSAGHINELFYSDGTLPCVFGGSPRGDIADDCSGTTPLSRLGRGTWSNILSAVVIGMKTLVSLDSISTPWNDSWSRFWENSVPITVNQTSLIFTARPMGS